MLNYVVEAFTACVISCGLVGLIRTQIHYSLGRLDQIKLDLLYNACQTLDIILEIKFNVKQNEKNVWRHSGPNILSLHDFVSERQIIGATDERVSDSPQQNLGFLGFQCPPKKKKNKNLITLLVNLILCFQRALINKPMYH